MWILALVCHTHSLWMDCPSLLSLSPPPCTSNVCITFLEAIPHSPLRRALLQFTTPSQVLGSLHSPVTCWGRRNWAQNEVVWLKPLSWPETMGAGPQDSWFLVQGRAALWVMAPPERPAVLCACHMLRRPVLCAGTEGVCFCLFV